MSFKIYHQLGHNYKWNLESLKDDHAGHGVIISPKHMEHKLVSDLSKDIKRISIFDPQFYLPNVARSKLSTYPFFPQLVTESGFSTEDYADNGAQNSAIGCVEFQCAQKFQYIIIPTRYISATPVNFVRQQSELFINHFLEVLRNQDTNQKVLLQLILNQDMLIDDEYSIYLLNWVTGILNIQGIYLIVYKNSRDKQIKDPRYLFKYLHFIDVITSNGMDVVLGYQNTEAILSSIGSPSIINMGSYENLRMFNIGGFEERKGKKRMQPPIPRIYSPLLLQWIDYRYLDAIKDVIDLLTLFGHNKYQAVMFQPSFNWHFQKPELYKHYFLEFSNQLSLIVDLNPPDRFKVINEWLLGASRQFEELSNKGVYLDADSDGSHIPAWLTAINQFARYKGWR